MIYNAHRYDYINTWQQIVIENFSKKHNLIKLSNTYCWSW